MFSGSPELDLNVGGSSIKASFLSGSGGSILLFSYVVGGSDLDLNGIAINPSLELNSGTIQDATGNNGDLIFTPPNLILVNVNGDAPFVTSFGLPSNKTYYNGEMIEVDLVFQ